MAKFDWQRKGQPRPGSGLGGHPVNLERPYKPPKTHDEVKIEKEELEAENAKREAALAPERDRQASKGCTEIVETIRGTNPEAIEENDGNSKAANQQTLILNRKSPPRNFLALLGNHR